MVTSVCEPCKEECMECLSLDICTKCHFGFMLEKKECVLIDPCKPPSSDPRSMVSSCAKCPKNCLFCEETTSECVKCEPGYFLDKNFCISCPVNCVFCVDTLQCSRCQKGFNILNGECRKILSQTQNKDSESSQSVITTVDNASKRENDGIRDTIKNGDKLQSSCLLNFTSESGTCSICRSSFYLGSDFKCYKCPVNCIKCLSDKVCKKCQQHFKLESKESKSITCVQKQVNKIFLLNV